MYNKQILKENLIEDLKTMGLKECDSLMVHSSMKSIGQVDGGADTVVDALMEYLSEGLLMMPTHTWAQMSAEYNVFDFENEPCCVGIIPNIFFKREGVVRSLHPTHSIAAYGAGAADYVKGEENCTTPCTPGGCWDRLKSINAKILLIGVNHVKNTYIHAVEEVLGVPERFTSEPTLFKIKMPSVTCSNGSLKDILSDTLSDTIWDGGDKNGIYKEVQMYRHYNPHTAHISESFQKLARAYEENGAAHNVRFGNANCILCDAKGIFEVTERVLSHELNCLIDRETIPEEWWR